MIKTSIEILEALLNQAREKGCKNVKLQLYDNWEDMAQEQKRPSHPIADYQVDVRYYNTIEFETEIKDMQATDKILTKMEGDTFIIQVSLSDRDTLMKTFASKKLINH